MRFARERVGASAASLFLVDAGAETLRGLVSEWDWTRTSFVSNLRDWPTVERALADGEPRTISREDASEVEADWFEPRGVVSALCVPLRATERPLGVLFFDFDAAMSDFGIDVSFLTDVGERCSRALARDPSHTSNACEVSLSQ